VDHRAGQVVVVECCVAVGTELVDQHLTVEVVAPFARLDDQPGNAPLEQRCDHAAEAFGSNLAVTALAVIGQRRHLACADHRVDDLFPAAVAFVDEMPATLTGQTERPRQASESVDVTVGDHRDAHVIAGPTGGFVDECLRAQLSTDDRTGRVPAAGLTPAAVR